MPQMSVRSSIQTRFVHHSELNWECPLNSNSIWTEVANKMQNCIFEFKCNEADLKLFECHITISNQKNNFFLKRVGGYKTEK